MLKKYLSGNRALANFGIAYTLSNGLQKGIGFLVFMYFATILSINEYAEFGLSYSIFTIISALASAGVVEAVVSILREKTDTTSIIRSANTVFIGLSVVTAILVFIMIGSIYEGHFTSGYFLPVLISGALLSSYFTYQSIIVRLEEKHLASIFLSAIPAIIGYLLGFVLTYYYRNGTSFFIGFLVAQCLSLLILFFINNNTIKGFELDKANFFLVTSRLFPYITIAVLAWIMGYGNTFFVKYLFNDFQVGLFVFLFTMSSIIQLIASSMNQVWAPRFYNNYDKLPLEKQEEQYRKFTILQGIVLGISGAAILFSLYIAAMFFPKLEKFSLAPAEMLLLFGGYIFSIPWWHCQNYFMINNKGKSLMYLTLSSGVLGYGIWIAMMFWLGPIGIYIGFLIQMALKSLFVYLKARAKWKVHFSWEGILSGNLILCGAYALYQLI